MPTDNNAAHFGVGDIVNIPCVVVSTGGSAQIGVDNLVLTPKYLTPNGSTPSNITSVYATQVVLDK